ncbi:hypothetical protein CCACVL1_21902 [Corchorus capsularis]|uniref:Uncharacterized protein n=1 Tax=Corchorus capsularis TaxID=210143 RepID=A0A1R3H1R4_COCAP|nr:hypothetical protein CCACVL1_21902 [Corchorus capsularis]
MDEVRGGGSRVETRDGNVGGLSASTSTELPINVSVAAA